MKCSHPQCTNQRAVGFGKYCRRHSITHGYSKRLVPARNAAVLIRWHLQNGATMQSLAKATGMGQTNLRQILTGQHEHVRQATIEALQAAHPEKKRLVPALGASRRLQSLRAAGKTLGQLVTGIGIGQSTIESLCRDEYEHINVHIDQKIRAYYREHITDTPTTAHWLLTDKGWKLPGQWFNIDDPRETH